MSLIDLLESQRIDHREYGEHHHVTRGWIGIDCPYCSPGSGRYHMGLNEQSRAANCWTCGKQPFYRVVMEATRLPWQELKDLLGDFRRQSREEHRGTLILPKGIGPLQKIHKRYLTSRGFDPDKLSQLWDIQGIGLAPRLQWRIFIPIASNGKVVSWTTRSTGDSKDKYHNAGIKEESYPAKQLLYGEEYCRHAVIVCEGPADVWRIGPGSVCTFGVKFSDEQVQRISRYPLRVVCYDKDAQKPARRLCRELQCFPGKTYRIEVEAKDPGEADKEEVGEIRRRFLDD